METVAVKPRRRWLSVLALSAAAFVDSGEDQTLSILWPKMHPSLGLTTGQLGPVLGVSSLVRTLTLPFWGYAADRFSRKALLVGITGIWGLWTLAISLVQSLSQLMIVRVLSSLGHGVLWPTAFSLLGDLFPSKERGRAAGIMTAVSFSGSLASFAILPALAARSPEAWRTGFVVMGLASFATGLLLLAINDPPRGSAEPEIADVVSAEAEARYAFRLSDLPELIRVRSWRVFLVHNSVDAVATSILYGWAFTWLDSIGRGGSAFIIVSLIALGNLLGHAFFGWLGDVLEARFTRFGRASMALLGLIVTAPSLAGFIAFSPHSLSLMIVFGLIVGLGLSSVDTGARWPIAQGVLRPELRATGRAALDMVIGVVGATVVALSGRLVDQVGVTTMMLILIPIPKLLGAISWLPIFWTYPRDRQELHEALARRREALARGWAEATGVDRAAAEQAPAQP